LADREWRRRESPLIEFALNLPVDGLASGPFFLKFGMPRHNKLVEIGTEQVENLIDQVPGL